MDRYSKVWMFVLIALVFTVQTETLEKQKLQAREMATLVEDGKAALLDRRFREAIALFSKPFEHDQSSQDISTLLALAHLGDDNYEESLKVLAVSSVSSVQLLQRVREIGGEISVLAGTTRQDTKTGPALRWYEAATKAKILMNPYQRPIRMLDHRLRAQSMWPSTTFTWLKELEDGSEAIRQEYIDYIARNGGDGLEEVRNHHGNDNDGGLVRGDGFWRELGLIDRGRLKTDRLEAFPTVSKILTKVSAVTSHVLGKTHFSVLDPHSGLKPHCGPTNYRLTAHLGITIPDECGIRVGGVDMTWEEGKVLVFDDSFEHEVWNNSGKQLVILLVNFWHPDVPEQECSYFQSEFSLAVEALEARAQYQPGKPNEKLSDTEIL